MIRWNRLECGADAVLDIDGRKVRLPTDAGDAAIGTGPMKIANEGPDPAVVRRCWCASKSGGTVYAAEHAATLAAGESVEIDEPDWIGIHAAAEGGTATIGRDEYLGILDAAGGDDAEWTAEADQRAAEALLERYFSIRGIGHEQELEGDEGDGTPSIYRTAIGTGTAWAVAAPGTTPERAAGGTTDGEPRNDGRDWNSDIGKILRVKAAAGRLEAVKSQGMPGIVCLVNPRPWTDKEYESPGIIQMWGPNRPADPEGTEKEPVRRPAENPEAGRGGNNTAGGRGGRYAARLTGDIGGASALARLEISAKNPDWINARNQGRDILHDLPILLRLTIYHPENPSGKTGWAADRGGRSRADTPNGGNGRGRQACTDDLATDPRFRRRDTRGAAGRVQRGGCRRLEDRASNTSGNRSSRTTSRERSGSMHGLRRMLIHST